MASINANTIPSADIETSPLATAETISPSTSVCKASTSTTGQASHMSLAQAFSGMAVSEAETDSSTVDELPMPSSAADRVFRIPELTEQILEHLPMKDLLVSQRICQGARSTVQNTPVFQRRLFLEPGSFHDVHEGKPINDARYVEDMVVDPEEWMEEASLSPPLVHYEVEFNPLLVEQCLNISGRSPLRFKAMPRITSKFLHDDLINTSSCRQMYLTQPPLRVKTTSISVNSKACNACHVGVHFLEEWSEGEKLGGGTTLGELVDHLRNSVAKQCKNMEARIDPESSWTFRLGEQEPDEEVEAEEESEEESWVNSVD